MSNGTEMIYDCFTFYNELDLLEIRLNELGRLVDYFVLVEASETFQGEPKPFIFENNKSRFKDFSNKIIHVKIDFPDKLGGAGLGPTETAWAREFFQRDQIIRGLRNARPDDLIIVGDVDEIISAEALRRSLEDRRKHTIAMFQMPLFFAGYNRKMPTTGNKKNARWFESLWLGSKMIEFSKFPGANNLRSTKPSQSSSLKHLFIGDLQIKFYNFFKWKIWASAFIVRNGGWHFSSIGNWEHYRNKIDSYCHKDENQTQKQYETEVGFKEFIYEATTEYDINMLPMHIQKNKNRYIIY